LWEGDVRSNGRVIKQFPGQELIVTEVREMIPKEAVTEETKLPKKSKKKKALKMKQEKWDQISDTLKDYEEWHLDYDIMEDYPDTPIKDELGFYILAEFPNEEDNNILQLPYGIEWAYFESVVSTELGEDKWIAAFDDGLQPLPWKMVHVSLNQDRESGYS
jgi:hypothetical protein